MFNAKDYSDTFVIKKERDDYTIKEYKGNVEGTLVIPEGITRISEYAFNRNRCSKIKKIIFPKSLKRVPSHNFNFWKQLEEIVIPEGVTTIGKEAFWGTGIREILLPSTINKIEIDAFYGCDELKKITVLHINTSILNSLLNSSYSCGWGDDVRLKFSLFFGVAGDIDLTDCFCYYNPKNETAKFSVENCFIMYANYIVGYIGRDTELTTPETSVGIAYDAFLNNKKIRSITLTRKNKSIGAGAFEGCSSLRKVFLNEGLEKIGDYAFADSGIESIRIPQKVNYVGQYAFDKCNHLKELIILKEMFGDYYRTDKWHSYWNSGCGVSKKIEYVDNT